MDESEPTNSDNNEFRWKALYAKRLESKTTKIFKYFRSNGIEPLLIKGWAAARNYPEGHIRTYTDIDIAVSSADYPHAERFRSSEIGQQFHIDLHCELRHLDSRPFDQILNDSLLIDLEGYPIRIPAAEDNLRILAAHWLNDGGQAREKLSDIYYAVQNRPPEFSWEKCLGSVSANRRTWVVAAIGAAHKYLGLEIDDLPFSAEAQNLPAWFTLELEAEWRYGTRIRPLSMARYDPLEFIRQVKKRLLPNPIQAAIENEGNLLAGLTRSNQISSLYRRTGALARKLIRFLISRGK